MTASSDGAAPHPAVPIAGQPHVVELPPVGRIVAHAGRNVLESTVVPMVVFYLLLQRAGLRPALLGAFAWSTVAMLARVLRGRRVPGILVAGWAALALRVGLAWLTGSAFVYLLQPVLAQLLSATAFIASSLASRPLIAVLVRDFVPLPAALSALPRMHQFFCGASALWGGVSLAQAATNITLLTTSSIGTTLLLGKVLCTTFSVLGIVAMVLAFRRMMRGHVRLVVRWRPERGVVPTAA